MEAAVASPFIAGAQEAWATGSCSGGHALHAAKGCASGVPTAGGSKNAEGQTTASAWEPWQKRQPLQPLNDIEDMAEACERSPKRARTGRSWSASPGRELPVPVSTVAAAEPFTPANDAAGAFAASVDPAGELQPEALQPEALKPEAQRPQAPARVSTEQQRELQQQTIDSILAACSGGEAASQQAPGHGTKPAAASADGLPTSTPAMPLAEALAVLQLAEAIGRAGGDPAAAAVALSAAAIRRQYFKISMRVHPGNI